jgi:signal transduction histidine kinase
MMAWADVAMAAAIFVWSLGTLVRFPHLGGATGHPLVLGVALAGLSSLPLAVRRRAPLAVLIIVFAGAVVYGLEVFPPSAVDIGELVALYSVGAHRPARTAALGLGLGVTFMVVMSILGARFFGPGEVPFASALFALAVGAGRFQRRRLAREAGQAAELEQARIAQVTAEERLNIARELHDAVGHAQTVVLFHAGVARMTFDTDPDRARRALAVVEDRSRATLEEMQVLVDSLRNSQGRQPLPKLADVDALASVTSEVGLDVSLTRDGATRPLPATVEVSAYRIIQEALTNVVRHANAHRVDVTLRYGAAELGIEVRDDGAGPDRPPMAPLALDGHDSRGGGKGLVGMRERALCLHGTLDAGPQPGGGFAVRALLSLSGGGSMEEVRV